MESIHEDRFVLFVRGERGNPDWPECSERPLASCPSYADARNLQRQLRRAARQSVIRFVGPAGGGD